MSTTIDERRAAIAALDVLAREQHGQDAGHLPWADLYALRPASEQIEGVSPDAMCQVWRNFEKLQKNADAHTAATRRKLALELALDGTGDLDGNLMVLTAGYGPLGNLDGATFRQYQADCETVVTHHRRARPDPMTYQVTDKTTGQTSDELMQPVPDLYNVLDVCEPANDLALALHGRTVVECTQDQRAEVDRLWAQGQQAREERQYEIDYVTEAVDECGCEAQVVAHLREDGTADLSNLILTHHHDCAGESTDAA